MNIMMEINSNDENLWTIKYSFGLDTWNLNIYQQSMGIDFMDSFAFDPRIQLRMLSFFQVHFLVMLVGGFYCEIVVKIAKDLDLESLEKIRNENGV